MIRFFCIRLSQTGHRTSPVTFINSFLIPTFSHKLMFNLSNSDLPESLTISYLQKSCGLSLQAAISVSRKLQLESTDNPDLVLNLLTAHGLSQTHIKNLITKRPMLLLADLDNTLKPNMDLFKSLGFSGTNLAKMIIKEPRVLEVDAKTVVQFFRENGFGKKQIATLTLKRPSLYLYKSDRNFKPKFEFLKSLGFSELDLATILSTAPYILERSLENQIIPCINVLRRVVGNDMIVQKVIMGCHRFLYFNVEKMLEPNMSTLVNHGVPESIISKIFLFHPKALLLKTDKLNQIINEVKNLGFTPTNIVFVVAVRTLVTTNKRLWEKKLEAYGSFGLSRDEIVMAFKLQPMFMIASEKKIRKSMDFFVNKLNLKPSVISKNPNLVLLSVEKRIIPRCCVLHILMSKELIKEDFNLAYMLTMTEKRFMEKLVTKYQDVVPEVVKAHQGRMEFQGFPRDMKM